jgi:hypothetical protein
MLAIPLGLFSIVGQTFDPPRIAGDDFLFLEVLVVVLVGSMQELIFSTFECKKTEFK